MLVSNVRIKAFWYTNIVIYPLFKEFSMLMEDMQGEFRSGPFDPKQWKKGTPVAAKYSVRFFITNRVTRGISGHGLIPVIFDKNF